MSQKEKYEAVMALARTKGFTKKISVNSLKACIMEVIKVKENSFFKFHIQNMEILGMIKQSDIVGVFDIIQEEM